MLQNAGGLYVATYKCAWRHSGVPFFDIWPSKSGPDPSVFYDFDLKMCFSPQRRAIFADRDLQNGSGAEGFCTFWRTNVLRATAACNFWTSQLPKWLRECGVLHILTFKCAFRHSRVPFFTCPPNSYLRTRRFSEPTFRTSGTTIHWENTAIRDFTNFFRACWTACEWLYTHVDLLASDLTDVDLLAVDMTAVLFNSRLLNFLRSYISCVYSLSLSHCLSVSRKVFRKLTETASNWGQAI